MFLSGLTIVLLPQTCIGNALFMYWVTSWKNTIFVCFSKWNLLNLIRLLSTFNCRKYQLCRVSTYCPLFFLKVFVFFWILSEKKEMLGVILFSNDLYYYYYYQLYSLCCTTHTFSLFILYIVKNNSLYYYTDEKSDI